MTEYQINENINFKQVLVINEDGEKLGIKNLTDALQLALSKNLDLVCIAPQANIPVCKILDYGKYKFESAKKEKESKKKQHTINISEVQISYTIQEHDMRTKANTVKRLIERGDSVRVVLRLRGREVSFIEKAKEKMKSFLSFCTDFSKPKKDVFVEGRDIKVILEGK